MHINFDMKLLERLSEGVIILNRTGQIKDFNQAAQPYIKQYFNNIEKLAALIEKVSDNELKTPLAIKLMGWISPHADSVNVFLCRSDKSDFSLVIAPQMPPVLENETADENPNFYMLIGDEIRHELTHVSEKMASMSVENFSCEYVNIARHLDRLSRLFVSADQLYQLNHKNELFREERLSLTMLISDVLVAMPDRHYHYSINQPLGNSTVQQGMLYGSAEWFKCGLRVLFEGFGQSAQPRSQIELRVRQYGETTVLTGQFMDATKPRGGSRLSSDDALYESFGLGGDIQIALARRIFKMYGGNLEISETTSDHVNESSRGIDSFKLILPTGIPVKSRNKESCGDCQFLKQAEAYALDLAALMPSNPVGANVSIEEIEFLMSVMVNKDDPTELFHTQI